MDIYNLAKVDATSDSAADVRRYQFHLWDDRLHCPDRRLSVTTKNPWAVQRSQGSLRFVASACGPPVIRAARGVGGWGMPRGLGPLLVSQIRLVPLSNCSKRLT